MFYVVNEGKSFEKIDEWLKVCEKKNTNNKILLDLIGINWFRKWKRLLIKKKEKNYLLDMGLSFWVFC